MKNIKMIVTDLDNTLLNDDKRISAYTLKIIEQCRARGIKFIPATARVLRVLERMEVIGLFPYDALICCNGSKIYHDDEIIYQRGATKAELDSFMPTLLDKFSDNRISVEINEVMHVNHQIEEVDPSEKSFIKSDLRNLPDALCDRIIMNLPDKAMLLEIAKILPEYMYVHGVSDSPICRVLHKDVTKAAAIDHLAKMWNIHPDEIVCFGDDENDLEMFDYCKHAIAMDNAIESVKTAATAHTKNNNADGVAIWLEEFVLS